MRKRASPEILHVLLILILGGAAYANSFDGVFIWDDYNMFVDNPLIRDIHNFISSLQGYHFNPQRYIGFLTFAANYHVGGLAVGGYHLVNLVIHLVNALLFYGIIKLSFKTPRLAANVPDHAARLALFAGLLFVVHPVQTQAVTYIVQRFASLATLFYLLALLCYIKGRLAATGRPRLFYYFATIVCAVLAMKTKETAFTLPLTVLVYELVFFKAPTGKRLMILLPILATLIIVPLSILSVDKPLPDIMAQIAARTRVDTDIARGDYLFTQARVIMTYLRLIFLPVGQNLDYDYPVYHSLAAPPVFLSFMVLIMLLGAAVYSLYRARRSNDHDTAYLTLFAFGVFYFFITMAVESSVLPIRDVIFEHRLYLSSPGIFLAITAVAFLVARRLDRKGMPAYKALTALLAVAILTFAGATYARNRTWKSGIRLWEDVAKKSPRKARVHNNLGLAYYKAGLFDSAEAQFKTAIRLKPDHGNSHNNLGLVYAARKLADKAGEEYEKALRLPGDSSQARAHNNLGLLLQSQGRIEAAIRHFQAAIRQKRYYPRAHVNLGVALESQGRTEEAVRHFAAALKQNPSFATAHYRLGLALWAKGATAEATAHFHKAVALRPDFAAAYNSLGTVYGSRGEPGKAIEYFKKAVRLKADYAGAYGNLGYAYAAVGRFVEAIDAYRRDLAIKDDQPNVFYSLGDVYMQAGDSVKALESLQKALSIKPDFWEAYVYIAVIHIKLGQYDKAIDACRAAIRLRPDRPEPFFNLSAAYAGLGRIEEAKKAKAQGIRKSEVRSEK